MMMRRFALMALAAMVAVGLFASYGSRAPSATASARIDPTDFTNPKPNRYFPLKPGTVSILRGSEDGEPLREKMTITSSTKVIQGVTTTVVNDVLHSKGLLKEKTVDWYAADNSGTVWYFGERTAVYNKKGQVVTREGSWRAGVDGAVAGIIMPAHPGPTDAYRQEYYKGHAVDQGWIVSRHEHVKVPYGKVGQVVRSYEWTRLEPDVVSVKFYGPGLGIVREADVSGGNELLELVRVKHI
ncbi:MAG: hypothetical protein H0T12_09185 [Actinobacteria bacterium]|nr:hypothetical protein [Actinomycetota bacterium]